MLFQPTNVLPDVNNGIGAGTVDLTQGLTVSWQVNGNSPMRAYKVAVFSNDTSSTKLYETGRQGISGGFYGTDAQGNIQRFTAATIPYATLTNAGITNGNQYKIKVLEYYLGADGNETTSQQRSMSVFNARSAPSLGITYPAYGDTVATRECEFTGAYSQAQGDTLTWVRWRIYNVTGIEESNPQRDDLLSIPENIATLEHRLIYDSGKMYNVMQLYMAFDGLLDSNAYSIILDVETSMGVYVSAGRFFEAEWSTAVLDNAGVPEVYRLNTQSTAVKVSWGGYRYITGKKTGSVKVENGEAVIGEGGSVTWDSTNGSALDLQDPWIFIMRTTLQKADVDKLFYLETEEQTADVLMQYGVGVRSLGFQTSSGISETYTKVNYDERITIIIVPPTESSFQARLLIRREGYTGELMPQTDLTPADDLPPNEIRNPYVIQRSVNLQGFLFSPVKNIVTDGKQNIDYIQLICGDDYVTDDVIDYIIETAYDDNIYDPNEITLAGSDFVATFENGTLDAGQFSIAGTAITGWAVYRENERESVALHLFDTDISEYMLYDYGCGSNQGRYRYLIYPIGDQKYITDAVITRWFNPVYENWSVIEAEYESSGYYHVLNEFVFGKNLSNVSVSNNNTPNVTNNFTRYATVQMSNVNYQSGTLSSLIGQIGYFSYVIQHGDTIRDIALRFGTTEEAIFEGNPSLDSQGALRIGQVIKVFFPAGIIEYRDDKELRDAIWNLSLSKNHLFLKSKKGDVIEIKIAGAITMESAENSAHLQTSVSLPWAQIGDAKNYRLIGTARVSDEWSETPLEAEGEGEEGASVRPAH